MLGSDLSYVRAQLKPLKPAALKTVAFANKVHIKTLRRLLRKESSGRGDTLARLALYFRTQEQRSK